MGRNGSIASPSTSTVFVNITAGRTQMPSPAVALSAGHRSFSFQRVSAEGDVSAERFDQTLRFRMTVIPYTGSDDWVAPQIMAAQACLMNNSPPPPAIDCKYCSFAERRSRYTTQ